MKFQNIDDLQVAPGPCVPEVKGASEVLLQGNNCEDLVTVCLSNFHTNSTVSPTDAFSMKGIYW